MAGNFKVLLRASCCAFLVAFFACSIPVLAAEAGEKVPARDSSSFAGLDRMNGYSLNDYPDFQKKWNLVTVRFRKDTGEIRMTYANDLAWQTLKAGKIEYPDGAVFAKIGLMTQNDPSFTSSLVPNFAQRFQLMVMDSKKNSATAGWGYAIFDETGKTFPGDPVELTTACHACHALVPERGYVFSQPMSIGFRLPSKIKNSDKATSNKRLPFETISVTKLPVTIRARLPANKTAVRLLKGGLGDVVFHGTIDEIRPSLAEESNREMMPALLISKDSKQFSIVFKNPERQTCDDSSANNGIPMRAVFTDADRFSPDHYVVRSMDFCEPIYGQK